MSWKGESEPNIKYCLGAAEKDAIMGEEVKKRQLTRRKSVAGERGSGPPSGDAEARGRGDGVVPVGSKKKPVAFFARTPRS